MCSTAVFACFFITGASTGTAPKIPQGLDLTTIRAVPVQHDGRWPPLDTAARDLVESVTGEEFYEGHDPVAVLLAWTFDAPAWRNAPLIPIRNKELRRELKLSPDKTRFSFAELTSHRHLHALVDDLSRIPKGRKLNPLEKKVSDIHDKLLTLRSIFSGRALNMIPNSGDPLGAWRPVAFLNMPGTEVPEEVSRSWAAVGTAFVAEDGPAFTSASQQLASVLRSLPAAYRPDPKLIETELRYNRIRPFRTAWQVMVAGALLSAIALWGRRRWLDVIAVLGLIAGFGVLTYGLGMRWHIAGRIPAANMFESLLFLSWGMGAFAIISMLVIRHRVVPLTASAMGAVALMLADLLPMDKFVRPIPPVLHDTVWMSIHVPIIMVSYSVLALGVLIAHVQLLTMALFPRRRSLAGTIDAWHYWYIHIGSILLLAGVATGSMWAASSWGRYWGWDPKEVWSLVALLGYLTILHVRIDQERLPKWAYGVGGLIAIGTLALIASNLAPLTAGGIAALAAGVVALAIFVTAHGPFATALKSVLAFWLIIMTYVGVNYVLGIGLHSYGFGTGAVVRYMFRIGGIDLALVLICCVLYLSRRTEPAGYSELVVG